MSINSFLDNQKKSFDRYAEIPEKRIKEFFHENVASEIELQTVLNALGNIKDKKILDLGCGIGRYSLRIGNYANEVVGVDISEICLEVAKRVAEYHKINSFVPKTLDFSKSNYEDYFDCVLAVNMLHHSDNLKLILKKIKNSLKKDGKLVIFEINPFCPFFIPFHLYIGHFRSHFHRNYFMVNAFSLKRYLEESNFTIIKITKYAMLPTFLYNYSIYFKSVNEFLNRIPLINMFNAFNIIECNK